MKAVITAITVATFFLSGCLTPKVWNKGLHTCNVEGERVYKAQDQSIAVEALVACLKSSYTTYFVMDGKVLEKLLRANSFPSEASEKILYIDLSGGQSSWQEYPSEAPERDVITQNFSDKFSSNVSTYNFNDPISVNVDGASQQIKMGSFFGHKQYRDPKSYPQLALLVPAAIGDVVIGIVMTPVLIFSFLYEGIAGHKGRPADEKK